MVVELDLKLGTEPKMMEEVAEQPKGEVQDLSYTELRARLPQEISNDIVQLISQSKQAFNRLCKYTNTRRYS